MLTLIEFFTGCTLPPAKSALTIPRIKPSKGRLEMVDSAAGGEYTEFIRRIREGDEQAAEELVRRYEPEIRLEVRGWLRLRNPALRRVFDSMDICQSVLASFFARAAIGQFDLDEPPQLIRLLVGMARKKVAEQTRHHQRQRRDVRRVGDADVEQGLRRHHTRNTQSARLRSRAITEIPRATCRRRAADRRFALTRE